MFTMLFPTKIVDSKSSYRSESSWTMRARLFPSLARFLIRIRFMDVKAVSEAEKYAENAIKITIAIILDMFKFLSFLL